MSPPWHHAADLLCGPLLEGAAWPVRLCACLCDLRPRFLPKGRGGRGYRAIARNGRVLLAADLPLAELTGRTACLRLQTWHRALLPGDQPKPHGLLLCVAVTDAAAGFRTRLVSQPEVPFDLAIDLGGGLVLEIRHVATEPGPCVRTATST